jgi:protein involved in polysaccharide export with SLBB domain
LGFPFPVFDDGNLYLPLIEPIYVEGMSIPEAQAAIREAYVDQQQLREEAVKRIIVTLVRPRTYNILVIREDSGGLTVGEAGLISSTKRGTGFTIELPAYENDVGTALARTGGLPGLDAANEVLLQRSGRQRGADKKRSTTGPVTELEEDVLRIPLRLRPGERLPFQPEDIVLQSGDVIVIEARDTEVFYTGGLLPAGEFILPRDYDLDVGEAILRVRAGLINGGIGINNLTGSILSQGIGFPSPSALTVLRRTPGGGQVNIRVDMNRAARDPRERILVQPGDILILQETIGEALFRYATAVFRLNNVFQLVNRPNAQVTATVTVP